MKRTVWIWELFGFALTSLLGTVLHFMYEWLDKAIWIAPFSGVNESTWEHMKLLFWPMLFYTLFQSLFFREYKSFWCVKLRGTLIGLSLIPLLFYTYNGVIGKSPDWINIAIFFVSALAVYVYETKALYTNATPRKSQRHPFICLMIIALLFVIFTFSAPELNVFLDPLTSTYGL